MEVSEFSTGLDGLDSILKGLLPGDNVVWQIDSVEDYQKLVTPYAEYAQEHGQTLVYFHFADHQALLEENDQVTVCHFRPEEGFEVFVQNIHAAIREAGRGACYVFDCLSVLANCWYSDQMLGNFFKLTCPYLFDLETLAYFGLFRNHHSARAIDPIRNTAQLFLDAYNHHDHLYIRPLKVQHRYSAGMNMLYRWGDNDQFDPISESVTISEIMTSAKWSGLHSDRRPGFWERSFIEANELVHEVQTGLRPVTDEATTFEQLMPMIITRDDTMRELASRYFSLEDILDVRRRMIGSGLIGGKAVGMLLARAILKQADEQLGQRLEEHDSFFIGSDVFYTYLVQNGIWWTRQKQRDSEDFYETATRARRLIITGSFPDYTLRQFEEMVDYFGQSPFIVRSSSLLEDNFGNAFAGKYDSVFCANQGPRSQRLEDFLAAVRTIYASSMSERALQYRARRGMLDQDEQMALLVMRVSGKTYGNHFYPPVAGVGFSFNPFVWSPEIDPEAGVIRLVFGLGTRAVDRTDDDYTRLVALNAPERRPEHNFDEVKQYTQRRVDYIDLDANHLGSGYFHDICHDCNDLPMDLLTSVDTEQARAARSQGRTGAPTPRVLTFEKLLGKTDFVDIMRRMLQALHKAYDYPVDIEFTTNFDEQGEYKINLVQCRPLQVQGVERVEMPTVEVADEDRIISARSAIIGQSRLVNANTFIYVVPNVYGALPIRARHEIARLLGKINRALKERADAGTIILLGPGRWGTSSPSLGIPVSFADINGVSIICEIVAMREDLIPDVSLGTHFLNELVEMDMLYLALFPGKDCSFLNEQVFLEAPSQLLDLVPGAEKWSDAVRVVRAADLAGDKRYVTLTADAVKQEVDCFLSDVPAEELS
ncbi:MAG: pyruvate, phosphate dikinase [Verrucomicrobia bacterium]|jgi:pyruvate, water dikinase|nr:pyruvate, phosphate dikinase [Verrucomicrobiota bacterium]MBT7067343.1 pyruvate, phosphate dikinase [Verrucomicrobiota bacterium]MBT7699528.1 pyruvate, phosphate dikinase [Verrucomicrobiota bacterium]